MAFGSAMGTLTRHNEREASQRLGIDRAKSTLRALVIAAIRIISQKQFSNDGDFYTVISICSRIGIIRCLARIDLAIGASLLRGAIVMAGRSLTN